MTRAAHNQSREEGLTLVELMVSMAIGLVLMTAVYTVFISSSDSYKRLEGLASIQERGRIAMNLLQNLIQSADYTGCRSSLTINNLLTTSQYEYNFGVGIEGYNSTGTGWIPALPTGTPAPIPSPLAAGGDIITIRGPVGNPVQLTAAMANNTSTLAVPTGSPFVQNDILMIGNCAGGADIFQKTDSGGSAVTTVAHAASGLNSVANLSAAYGTEAMVVKVGTVSIFVRTNTRGIRSLWWKEGTANAEEILEAVDAMEVLYGITTNTDTSANRYLTADAVADWSRVVSIRIALLVATDKPVLRVPETSSHDLLGTTYTFTDQRQRRVFMTNIVLRNRSF